MSGHLVLLLALPAFAQQPAPPETTVGMSGHLEQLVLPGTELEGMPIEDRKAPVVIRVVRVFPHGTAFRYDLEYQGLEPGTFDLKNYLRRKDGSATADLPSIPVTVVPLLPPGQVTPNPLVIHKGPFPFAYLLLMIGAGTVWVIGLVAILWYGFLRRKPGAADPATLPPVTLADRLRPLVEGAIAGRLSQPQLASLERTLLAYWRKRLNLERADPARAIEELRSHSEAGPLLNQLKAWLHRPDSAGKVDPARLLEPYTRLPADTLEGSAI